MITQMTIIISHRTVRRGRGYKGHFKQLQRLTHNSNNYSLKNYSRNPYPTTSITQEDKTEIYHPRKFCNIPIATIWVKEVRWRKRSAGAEGHKTSTTTSSPKLFHARHICSLGQHLQIISQTEVINKLIMIRLT